MKDFDATQPVILIRSSKGRLVGCCSAQCYNDEGFHCTCVCGGENHGVGRKQAAINTQEGIEIDWTKTWAKIPKSECTVVIPRQVHRYADQLELFPTPEST